MLYMLSLYWSVNMRISQLPQKYQKLAIKRMNEYRPVPVDRRVPIDRVVYAFCWESTPEGYDFWNLVENANKEGELPPFPSILKQRRLVW